MIESVGFTGTRQGMTKKQATRVIELIESIGTVKEFHHGDCIGADAQMHELVRGRLEKVTVEGHPPRSDKYRAYKEFDIEWAPQDYLVRNHDIVDSCDLLFAAPYEKMEQVRSGTWATVRYAAKTKTTCVIVFHDGTVVVEVNSGVTQEETV